MSTVNSFDKNQHFAELNSPLFTGNPVPTTPAARKVAALANLGATAAIAAAVAAQTGSTLTSARFANQPLLNQQAPTVINSASTLLSADMLNGLYQQTNTANQAQTLPAPATWDAAVLAAYPNLANGDSLDVYFINTGSSSGTLTLTASGAFTIVGNAVVAIATT